MNTDAAGEKRGGGNWVLAIVITLICVPLVVALTAAVSFKTANRDNRSIVIAGRQRGYVLHVPKSYDRRKPTPLVISMHGAGLWGAAQKEISRWNDLADREGIIVVYPSALRGSGPATWSVEHGAGLMRDVAFIAALIDTLSLEYNVDSTRIYANGLSNGGGMSFVLSCTLSNRIAAVGLVASAQTLEFQWCTDTRPVPMIAFHGTEDPAVPYNGGTSWVLRGERRFPNLPKFVASWARRNGCAAVPRDSAVAVEVTRRLYVQCADNATVALYTIYGGGHTWPGGKPLPESWMGTTTARIDANELMWSFYLAHPLSRHSF
jgi:polyhydroxybutyrate depolymerase